MLTTLGRPSETSARMTAFCTAEVKGPGGSLWIDGNGKITAGNGTLKDPKPNAFSLVQIEDCPGATPTCKASCYVHGLEKHAPDTHSVYRENSRMIREVVNGANPTAWASLMGEWIEANCKGGFRWHVSGDIWSVAYAEWIADVCAHSPSVRHWIYTRSLAFVDGIHAFIFKETPNLTVNISCDTDNYAEAKEVAERQGLRLCFLTQDGEVPLNLRPGDVIFTDYNLRGGNEAGVKWFDAQPAEYKKMVCPVDFHGKAEERRCGPCMKCIAPKE